MSRKTVMAPFCVLLFLLACIPRQVVKEGELKFSTGHMGMPGENVFVIKADNTFYYYERLLYSEGTFERVDDNKIKLTSIMMGFPIPYKDEKMFHNLSGNTIEVRKNKIFFRGFTMIRAK